MYSCERGNIALPYRPNVCIAISPITEQIPIFIRDGCRVGNARYQTFEFNATEMSFIRLLRHETNVYVFSWEQWRRKQTSVKHVHAKDNLTLWQRCVRLGAIVQFMTTARFSLFETLLWPFEITSETEYIQKRAFFYVTAIMSGLFLEFNFQYVGWCTYSMKFIKLCRFRIIWMSKFH